MDNLFSFIVPIIAIVVWFLGLTKSKEEQDKQQTPPRPKQAPQQTHTQTENQTTEVAEDPVPNYQSSTTTAPSMEQTFTQQKEKQMKKLKDKIKLAEDIRSGTKSPGIGQFDGIKDGVPKRRQSTVTDKDITLSVESNLNSKGIAQGIIMAEVLGPPRAYQKRKYSHRYR
ncbi:hypothetical protein SH601_08060 [Gracilibacillus sp. S3-1-1]|uniref:Uncharacterized protein n=1 Tax=Gracilibacillus pellucidus TaxID=3095368 RepID=A0ACC6M4W5_9BACI|nr:hypothetical protein [Gracilibacillus sp. S3-1-1]MDX8045946.1 hypothetical protein [Gracilibacillus sp. S3-1-1]